MDSLQTKAFIALLSKEAKREILETLAKELNPGEPLYNGNTSRQIIKEHRINSH